MITFIRISLINMIVSLITENNRLNEQEAIFAFYNSGIADKLADADTGLYLLSPYIIYDFWNAEYLNDDYTKSEYYNALV